MTKKNGIYAVALITSLFFLWGIALNLNSDILVPHLKKACQLSFRQSGLVDSAFYIAYFTIAIPAGAFMHKFGYKKGIVFGLMLFAVGAFLFYPAAQARVYIFFLISLFILASGCCFLETAANPYINNLGDPHGATQRINFAQSFNGLAASIAPYLGGEFILSGKNLSQAQLTDLAHHGQLDAYLQSESDAVKIPYLIIGLVVLCVAILVWRADLPDIKEHNDNEIEGGSIFKEKNLLFGVLGIFFYVGAQAGFQSYFIFFSENIGGFSEKTSSKVLIFLAFLGFMVGRFTGTYLMKFISPAKLLMTYCIINISLLLLAFTLPGSIAVFALMGVPFFMSIMFPTIFSLSIHGLGAKTKRGASLLVMGIVGGAVLPPIIGLVTDVVNIRVAYLIPIISFAYIFYFALRNIKVKELETVVAH
ncbi:MAG: L-fucose:H+ symporter permease [Bacteroidetes bacterium]|jgi:FHS family L-fucose permease-like MFS transporter|nr:L-fucose:H+ symporter permease [Bacteroidota bacterium]